MSNLLQRLTEERCLMEAFIELLDEEAQALINGDLAGLPALTERKGQLADRIATVDREREREQGVDFTTDCSDSNAAELKQAWHALLERVAQARERNYRNGALIHTHLDFARESINFLRANDKPLYGPDGQHKPATVNGSSIASG